MNPRTAYAILFLLLVPLLLLACSESRAQTSGLGGATGVDALRQDLLIKGLPKDERAEALDLAEQIPHTHGSALTAPEEIDPETGRPTRGTIAHEHGANFPGAKPIHEKFEQDGVTIEFTAESFLGAGGRGGELAPVIVEGRVTQVKFKVSDADTGAPLTNLNPAVWLDLVSDGENIGGERQNERTCRDRIGGYVQGQIGLRPTIDLNGFFILALNNEANISVIDPMVDVAGMTNLYSMMNLPGLGEDWVLSKDQQRLFTTVPSASQVSAADLDKFVVIKNIDVGTNPVRIALQPDERYLWVGNDGSSEDQSGITVIDPISLRVIANIPTGTGHHELAFSPDSRYAFVTNGGEGTLSVIDTQTFRKVKDLQVGPTPVAVAVSSVSRAIYVAGEVDGAISVIDGDSLELVGKISTFPGLKTLRFAPDGRWGLAANPRNGVIYVFDSIDNEIVYEVPVEAEPIQISFSKTAAYVRSNGAPTVTIIPLAEVRRGAALSVVTMPIGQTAPGGFPSQATADAIFPTAQDGAVLVANPADDQIYFYIAGSQAPQGSFQGHGLMPRAALAVDRSLQEVVDGLYTATVRMPRRGSYRVAFLLDSPKVVHCFEMSVTKDPDAVQDREAAAPQLEFLTDARQFTAGDSFDLKFTLTDPQTGQPITGLNDFYALVNQNSGNWKQFYGARSLGDGEYKVSIDVPRPGLYQIFFAAPSLKVNYDSLPKLYLKATAADKSN